MAYALFEQPLLSEQGLSEAPQKRDPRDVIGENWMEEQTSESREWVNFNDLDEFFQNLYAYFLDRGFWPRVLSQITNLMALGFTIIFTAFLFLCVNWSALGNCTESDCHHKDLISTNPYKDASFGVVIVTIYVILFGVYWFWNFLSLCRVLSNLKRIEQFYSEKLGITDTELIRMEWQDVVERIVRIQSTTQLFHVRPLDALDIRNRMMRRENFLISMFNKQILDISCPWGACDTYSWQWKHFQENESNATPPLQCYLGRQLEWNIRFCTVNWFFDDKFELRKDILADARLLRKRFQMMGLVNFVLLPFAIAARLVFFFLKHAESMHSQKNLFFNYRQWTPLAQMKMRELNELPHEFERRIRLTHEPAGKFASSFRWSMWKVVAEFVAYVAGSFVAVLLVLTLYDSSILLYVVVGGRALVWWLAIFSAVLAISRGLDVEEDPTLVPEEAMLELSKYTHWLPDHWREDVTAQSVKLEFSAMYQNRLTIFLNEMLNVISTPFVLFLSLPECSEKVVDFIKCHSVTSKAIGSTIDYARFNFAKYGDPTYAQVINMADRNEQESGKQQEEKDQNPQDSETQRVIRESNLEDRLMQGKLEKSFLTFSLNNPDWQTDQVQSKVLFSMTQIRPSKRNSANDENDDENDDSPSRKNLLQESEQQRTPSARPLQFREVSNSGPMDSTLTSVSVRQPQGLSVSTAALRVSFSTLLRRKNSAFSEASSPLPSIEQPIQTSNPRNLPLIESHSSLFSLMERYHARSKPIVKGGVSSSIWPCNHPLSMLQPSLGPGSKPIERVRESTSHPTSSAPSRKMLFKNNSSSQLRNLAPSQGLPSEHATLPVSHSEAARKTSTSQRITSRLPRDDSGPTEERKEVKSFEKKESSTALDHDESPDPPPFNPL